MNEAENAGRQRPITRALDDVEVELARLVFGPGIVLTIVLASIICVGATVLFAYRYNDRWLWLMASAMAIPCSVRMGIVFSFLVKDTPQLTGAAAYRWHLAYGLSVVGYTSVVALVTVYNFQHHDFASMLLCTVGIFAYSGGVNTRLGLRPWMANASGLIMLCSLALAVLWLHQPLMRMTIILIAAYASVYCRASNSNFKVVVQHIRDKRKLRELSELDSLTGLANRRSFQMALTEACRNGMAFAVLFIDLDKFKAVNDTFGHGVGDQLLQYVSERLKGTMRSTDVLARLGGDEFAILHMHGLDLSSVTLADRINRELSAPFIINGHHLAISASIGIRLSAATDVSAEELLSTADAALYAVKRSGGGSFSLAAAG